MKQSLDRAVESGWRCTSNSWVACSNPKTARILRS